MRNLLKGVISWARARWKRVRSAELRRIRTYRDILNDVFCSPPVLLLLTLVMFVLVLSLFPLKIGQVEREAMLFARYETIKCDSALAYEAAMLRHYHRPNSPSSVDLATLKGLGRRFDDPSFWFLLCVALAGGCIFLARCATSNLRCVLERRHLMRLLVLSILLVSAYVIMCGKKKETFFWKNFTGTDNEKIHQDWIIVRIQMVEGVINLVGILIGCSFFVVGQATYRALRSDSQNQAVSPRSRRLALGALLSAGFMPLAVFGFAFSVMAILNLTDIDKVYGPFSPVSKVLVPCMGIPFIVLFLSILDDSKHLGIPHPTNGLDLGVLGEVFVTFPTLGALLALRWFEVRDAQDHSVKGADVSRKPPDHILLALTRFVNLADPPGSIPANPARAEPPIVPPVEPRDKER